MQGRSQFSMLLYSQIILRTYAASATNRLGGCAQTCFCPRARETVGTPLVLQCPLHRPSHGLHGPTVLNEAIELLLNTCPEI